MHHRIFLLSSLFLFFPSSCFSPFTILFSFLSVGFIDLESLTEMADFMVLSWSDCGTSVFSDSVLVFRWCLWWFWCGGGGCGDTIFQSYSVLLLFVFGGFEPLSAVGLLFWSDALFGL
jgi:hypothetical protein